MKKKKLDGKWRMKSIKTGDSFVADVPGSVYETLLNHKQMEDPFWRDNENAAMELMKDDYEYELAFQPSEEIWMQPVKELVFEGIDTIADIYLNDILLDHVDNMHRTWRYDISSVIRKEENHLRVYLHAPIPYIRNEYKKCRSDGSEEAMVGFAHIRKAHYMFGWDWGAHLPDAGIFRSVTLLGIKYARIENVFIHQVHKENRVTLDFKISEMKYEDVELSYDILIQSPDGKQNMYHDPSEKIVIEDPLLWWPNGYGEQNLYDITVIQYGKGIQTDRYHTRIGLRTLQLHRQTDQWGESFAHCVNGIDCFAMGADYIPEDNLLGRLNEDRTRKLLQYCKECNFNLIRVWGGGFFPADWFYECCDEMGIMVWQDLMFACAVYELDDHFEENISAEIKDNLQRIANHASLALVCGNNEMEMFVNGNLWITRAKQKADYIKMYEYLFPKLVRQYAPQTDYWPASPSSGGSFDEPNDYNRGDVHYWDVWHNNMPFTEYRKYYFRYLSEFGFQSIPGLKTIETFTDREEDYNLFSYCMEKHQRNKSANAKIIQYLQQMFLYPSDFKTLIYASQILQGEAVKYGVEHLRRNRGRCMGAVYWQLNDCWPVISWSSIDYCGRWKALQYYAKRFFAPLLLSCEETGMLSEEININGENETFCPAVRFNVSNESAEERSVLIEWELRNNDGEILKSGAKETVVDAFRTVWLEKEEFEEIDIFKTYISYRLIEGTDILSRNSVIFTPPKYFHFVNPHLTVKTEGEEIIIESKAYAKCVEIQNREENLILSDNYFDMNPGIYRVKVYQGELEELQIRSVYDIS